MLGSPKVDLKAVTIVPGTPDQIGLIRSILSMFNRKDLPLGAFNQNARPALSPWYSKVYGTISPSNDALEGFDILNKYCDENTTLITGGPLKNVHAAIKTGKFKVGKLVSQGGFAGSNIVPEANQLSKFRNTITVNTWNLGGDIPAALAVLDYKGIGQRHFVSKNVCHGVLYNIETHGKLEKVKDNSQSLSEIYRLMSVYLLKKGEKALHDPLACCCAIDSTICEWKEVELYLDEKKKWGSRISDKINTKITIGFDKTKFFQVLFAHNNNTNLENNKTGGLKKVFKQSEHFDNMS